MKCDFCYKDLTQTETNIIPILTLQSKVREGWKPSMLNLPPSNPIIVMQKIQGITPQELDIVTTNKILNDLSDWAACPSCKQKVMNYSRLSSSSRTPSQSSSSGGGCFIATAIYGSYNHPKVILFRKFRDHVLFKNILGKLFIKIYYIFSPQFSKLVIKNKNLNRIIKNILDHIANYLF